MPWEKEQVHWQLFLEVQSSSAHSSKLPCLRPCSEHGLSYNKLQNIGALGVE